MPQLTFRNLRIIITGASSGLGCALAQALAMEGAQLLMIARDRARLEAAADRIRQQSGATIHALAADLTDAAARNDVILYATQVMRGIDVLINNAGILRENYFERLSDADFRDVMETNFHAAVGMSQLALPELKASRGRLINIASVAGLTGTFGYAAYCASKHALVGFSECLQYELPLQGVQVHLVCPAEFDSPMVDALDQTRSVENRAHTLTIPKVGVDVIVRDTLKGLRRGDRRIVPGRLARWAVWGLRMFPNLSYHVGLAKVRKSRTSA